MREWTIQDVLHKLPQPSSVASAPPDTVASWKAELKKTAILLESEGVGGCGAAHSGRTRAKCVRWQYGHLMLNSG